VPCWFAVNYFDSSVFKFVPSVGLQPLLKLEKPAPNTAGATKKTPLPLNAEGLLASAAGEFPRENRFRNEDGRENIGRQTNRQSHRKALHRTFTEQEQEGALDDSRHVGVHDSPPSLAKSRVHGRHHRFPGAQFLTDALEDQHVGIDRHTNGQNYARDSG
jgi:hypothetical protein